MSIRGLTGLASAALAIACGSMDPASAPCGEPVGDEYLPLTEGAEWTFDVTDAARDAPLGEKSNRIVEKLGEVVKIENGGNTRPGFRWLRRDGSRYAWVRNLYYSSDSHEPESDQYYESPALRFDSARTTVGESWIEAPYTKTTIDVTTCPGWSEERGIDNLLECPPEAVTSEEVVETWTVIAVDEQLSGVQATLEPERTTAAGVPAGDFPVVCHERACADASTCIMGTYCFARGIGKVFELSTEREELKTFCMPSE